MSVHRPVLNINLLARVSSEDTVVFTTVCKVPEGVQDVIVETADCVMVLNDSGTVPRKISSALGVLSNCEGKKK